MAKGKRTINDIQKALLSTTRYIKDEESVIVPEQSINTVKPIEAQVNIDPLVMKQVKILAPFMGETTDELINKALNHYLRLKSLQLDKAIEKLTQE